MPHGGLWATQSGVIGHSQTNSIEVTLNFSGPGSVTFWRRTSSESSFDFLRFFIDGVQQGAWSGATNWTEQTFPVPAGNNRKLRWAYQKDGSVNSGADAVWVDDITTVNGFLP